ncbi:hypothetical protein BDB01DRAFT_785770 [Pilobolus umbonatus]|nr:hypothetical protein BDB01DRAFT_785770 [Pilobolus umbonatus]
MAHIDQYIHYTRLMSLITAISIVIISLCVYSKQSIPLASFYVSDEDDTAHYIIQSIIDRRLIATLVASHASIFCPLFTLLNTPTKSELEHQASAIVDMLCQAVVPLGLALSWMFSILFDSRTIHLIQGEHNSCFSTDTGAHACMLFDITHGLKYLVIFFFAVETMLVCADSIVKCYSTKRIQLPGDDIEKSLISI